MIAYTRVNAPVYQRVDYLSNDKIYFYHECGEWIVTPIWDPDVLQCPLYLLSKESSGSLKLESFEVHSIFSELNPIKVGNGEPTQFNEIEDFYSAEFAQVMKTANITIVPVYGDQ